MDHLWRKIVGLVIALSCVGAASLSHAAAMPAIQPIAVQPVGAAAGNGIATQVTYQIGGAAVNDAGVAAAANEASYVTRAVTMSGGTIGGIVRGAVAGGSRLIPWVSAALAAYQIYKWYTDQSSGQLMAPGQNIPSVSCGGEVGYWTGGVATACSLPGLAQALASYYAAHGGGSKYSVLSTSWPCGTSSCTATINLQVTQTNGSQFTVSYTGGLVNSAAPAGTQDIAYTTSPQAVTNDQLAALAQSNPNWWPQMFTDPLTGNVVVNPDIAHDMDALKQDLAPKYGVDPTTLSPTPSDPHFDTQTGTPKQTDLPQYCAWAASACNYYKFVEDNWPSDDKQHQYTDSGCDAPPGCSGDQVLCGLAQNTWVAKCSLGGDGTKPPEGGKHVVGELDNKPTVDTGDTSKLDNTGLGWGTACPFADFTVDVGGVSKTLTFAPVCDYGPWMRGFVLLLAAFGCAGILGGFKIGSIFGGS